MVLGALLLLLGLLFLSRDLPEMRTLADYHPPQTTVVYGAGGEIVGRFAQERRTVVPFSKFPDMLVKSVLASEDAGFYEHEGVDYLGIARCVVINVLSGRKRCGGSTITQQTVKTFFLTPEKTYTRKLRELVLAKRVEESLEKNDILFLYLNQIYYGHGAYGAQEAARVYFGKDVSDLNVPEAALLAGLPQSPSRLDPYRHPERARKRRSYVLRRLAELGHIDEATRETSDAAPLDLAWGEHETYIDNGSHYVAHVKKILLEHPEIGEEQLLNGGLAIHTGLDPKMQAAADKALEEGARAIDKRQGWRGPLLHLEPSDAKALVEQLEQARAEVDPNPEEGDAPIIWDLSDFATAPRNALPEQLAELARTRRFDPKRTVAGLVTEVSDGARKAVVSLGGDVQVTLPLRGGLGWARKFSISGWTPAPKRPSDVLSVGDVVRVAPEKPAKGQHQWTGQLEQRPLAEAAVVVIDPTTREVRALSGGYGTGAGTFNRAVQARRQAGSTFKPFVYAAAFETRAFTPISTCLDAPRVIRDPHTGKTWKPHNYGHKFDGEMSLRRALTLSKNLCSVRLIEDVGVDKVLSMAHRLGVQSPLPKAYSLALGAGDVTPLEMTNAYATLAAQGQYREPIFVRKVTDPQGQVLLESNPEPKQVVDPAVVFQVVSMMQSVVEEGTAQRVKQLERPVAGKTGTTNEARNAWFVGFTPDLVAGVWVGFDDNRPLGPSETGGRAAIPIWLDTMTSALADRPPLEFVAPSTIVFATVNPKTGKLVPPDDPEARTEPFLAGTEPDEIAAPEAPTQDRPFMDDY